MNASSKLLVPAIALALAACSSSNNGSPGGSSGDAGTATFTQVYATILQPTCSSCHSASGPDKFLDFSSQASAYASLTAAPSGPACGSAGLSSHVVAGNAGASLLYEKVSQAKPPCGAQMPYGHAPISASDQELIATWIDDGAQDD